MSYCGCYTYTQYMKCAQIEVFQFTLNTSLLNCFLSNTPCCYWWCYRTPQGKTTEGISAQEGKLIQCCCSCSCLSVSPYVYDVGVFCWNFPSAPMHCFPVLVCTYHDGRLCSRYDSLRDMSWGFVLLNCGCRVYTRVNSFLVWISCIEGSPKEICSMPCEIHPRISKKCLQLWTLKLCCHHSYWILLGKLKSIVLFGISLFFKMNAFEPFVNPSSSLIQDLFHPERHGTSVTATAYFTVHG